MVFVANKYFPYISVCTSSQSFLFVVQTWSDVDSNNDDNDKNVNNDVNFDVMFLFNVLH